MKPATGGAAVERPSRTGNARGCCGYTFMCNNRTRDECLNKRVFGLPAGALDEMQQHIGDQTLLFLFDLDRREMHGPFLAACKPGRNLVPGAWAKRGSATNSRYPAQVRVLGAPTKAAWGPLSATTKVDLGVQF